MCVLEVVNVIDEMDVVNMMDILFILTVVSEEFNRMIEQMLGIMNMI